MTLVERFADIKYRARNFRRGNSAAQLLTSPSALVVEGLTVTALLAGCDITVHQNPPVVLHPGENGQGNSTTTELNVTDPNLQLLFKAATDYKDLNPTEKGIIAAKWNIALETMQDITQLNHKSDSQETGLLIYKEDGVTLPGNMANGEISKHDIQPVQMGKIITFKDGHGVVHDLGFPFLSTSDGTDYTKNNQHMIPGFYGGYQETTDGNYVFFQILPNTQKITAANTTELHTKVNDLKSKGIEVEGNDKLGYYEVNGYSAVLFQVDGKDTVGLSGTGDKGGYAFGYIPKATPEQVITGNGKSEQSMGNDQIGNFMVVVYGGSGDANTQLLNYVRNGGDKPAFVTSLSASTDASGKTTYSVNVDPSHLPQLPYTEGLMRP